jgi:c-di-GMP-binding flagellar brake protein YcgR
MSRPEDLLLKVGGGDCASASFLEINYVLEAKLHRFRAEIASHRPMGTQAAIIKLHLPERIGVLNRREYLRLRPPPDMPITLKLYPPTGDALSCQARDISSGGLGFSVPMGSTSLGKDAQIAVRIHLPDGPIVPAAIRICHLIPEGEMVRVGAEFISLSSQGRQKICDYVIKATLGPDRFNFASVDQLPLVCVIGEDVEEEDLAQLANTYRLIRHNLNADWRRLVQIEPDALLFRNLGGVPAERLIPKVKALPSLKKAASVLITDQPDLDTDLDAILVSSKADTASVIAAMETSITQHCKARKESALDLDVIEVATEDESETVLVLNLHRRISLKTICCMKLYKYRIIVQNSQDQILRSLAEQRPALMLFGAASVKDLKPLLDELASQKALAHVPRVVLVDPPQRVDVKRLSQPLRLSDATFLFFRTLPETELVQQIFSILEVAD